MSVSAMDFTTADLPDGRIFVAGTFREGRGPQIESRFPADDSLNRVMREAGPEDLDESVSAAQKAAADPAWRDLLPHRRADYLYRISQASRQTPTGLPISKAVIREKRFGKLMHWP